MCHTVSRLNNKAGSSDIKDTLSVQKDRKDERVTYTRPFLLCWGFLSEQQTDKTRKRELTQLTLNVNVSVWGFMEC